MKKEHWITIILFMLATGGSFIYSMGVTDNKIENITKNIVPISSFAAQQQRVNDLVVTVNKVVGRLDRLIEIMMEQRLND